MAPYGVVLLSIFMMAATAVLAGACGSQPGGTQQQVGKMQHDSKSVDPKGTRSVRAQLKVGYDVSGKKGELVVEQGSANGGNLSGGARNEWDIGMNDELPTDLVVRVGA